MEVSREENLPPPPGIINSIKAGFDAISMRVTAIIFPLLLNLFLWLGPRLRLDVLFDAFKNFMLTAKDTGVSPADVQRALDEYQKIIPNINLFWLLRSIPIGISSLQFAQETKTPFGSPAVLQVDAVSLFGWIALLSLIGWIGGGLYFRSVARLALADDVQSIGVPRAIIQTIILSIAWGIISMAIVMPTLLFLAVLMRLSMFLAQIFVMFLSFVSIWAVVPLYFWSHGVFIKKQNAVTSMMSSLQMTRFTLPASSMFVLTVFLLAFGLNFLWSIPPADSWMTLVGIFGHSFVTTALLAGSFIYYRDMNIWLQAAMEKFRVSKQVNTQENA